MDTTPRTRFPAVALVAALIWTSGSVQQPAVHTVDAPPAYQQASPTPLTSALLPDPTVVAQPAEIIQPLTADQQDLVDWARSRFQQAGLDLPLVDLYFHDNSLDCSGHVGLYYRGSNSLHMCRLDRRTILHELAHAWANQALTEADRKAFLNHRGLQAWNDHALAWNQRGTEHAAEVIAWALMDRNLQVPFLPEEGRDPSYRLLTIADSEPDQLTSAYQLLTGTDLTFRDPTEWQPAAEMTSPEAARLNS
ncbi:MAG: hypothetical protein OEM81_02570 [Acidimicrobiia bacterium]|nr:hypothetical protein [Acidimicrobiia bacterium]MDH3396698.1 hypothetical protein [Acidimicrobiia bacterium]